MASRVSILLFIVLLSVAPLAAQQTGSIDGTVKDEQGGVLPGVTVTVSGPALIEGSRSTTTGPNGTYRFASLPPGTYTLQYSLPGFATLSRDGIRVSVARTTSVDVTLRIGGVEETITVTGESPIVDVRSTVTQTNIEADLYEAVPTGRNPWVMAGLVPGVVTGRLDVGGTEGMQQYALEVFGSADSQKTFSIDGLKTNWPGGSGGATMQYYDFGMYEEYNFQTASGTAESDVSGIYMNMVTKSGGNDLSGTHVIYFMNDSMQSSNVDEDLRRRVGLGPDQETALAGNPIDVSYDWNSSIGGPIVRDKAWFFGSLRWWRLDQFQIGTVNPEDGSTAIDDNRIRNFMGKVTYQVSEKDKLFFMFNRNLKDRFHRRDASFPFTPDKATWLQDQPAQNFVADYNRVLSDRALVDVRFGRMWGTFPLRYQKEVGPNDITVEDAVRGVRLNAATQNFENPNSRFQLNASLQYFLDNESGSHDFKFGVQLSRERMQRKVDRNGDLILRMVDGVPDVAVIFNSPFRSDARINTWAAYAQDSWTIRDRLTLNLGARFDGIHGFLPPQSSPAGTFVGERRFEKIDDVPDWPVNVAPRIGFSFDLFGDGRTAVKGYYGRFYNQIGSEIPEGVNPNDTASSQVDWNDLDGDGMLALGPSGTFADSPELDFSTFRGFAGGATTVFDRDADRPYNDEFNVGISHTLTTDLAISVEYHRRHHRKGLGILDRARPPSAYSPLEVSYVDPVDGPRTITVFDLDPALRSARDRIITNVAELESNYDGVHIQLTKRMSNRWQLLAGLTLQDHKGFFHDGTFTNADFNDPNVRINRDGASIFTELPWVLTVSGSYRLPGDVMVAAKYTGRDGDPLRRLLSVRGLVQGTERIDVVPRGTDRTDTIDQFVDVRLSKGFRLGGGARLEGQLDIFNVLNANHVLQQNEGIGSTFGRPSRILTPRIIRVGARLTF